MKLSGKDVGWTVRVSQDSLSRVADMETHDGAEYLVLSPTASGAFEAVSDAQPVIPSQAYAIRVAVRPDLYAAHAELYLRWNDSKDNEISRATGPFTFMAHDLAEEWLWGLAPAKAATACLIVRLVSDQTPRRKAKGSLAVGSPNLKPSLWLEAEAEVEAALFDGGAPPRYGVRVAGAPEALASADLQIRVSDYDGQVLHKDSAVIALAGGAGEATITLPPHETGYYLLQLAAEGAGVAPARTSQSYGHLPSLGFCPPPDYPVSLDAGMS